MSSNEARSRLVGKLAHPLNEVRERVLEQLKDELLAQWPTGEEETSELLHALLASFFRRHWRPSHQQLVLSLLRDVVKSEWGPTIVEKMGAHRLLESLQSHRGDVDVDARGVLRDLIAAVQPLSATGPGGAEEESPRVPRLHITSPSCWNGSSDEEGRAGMTCSEPVAAEVTRNEPVVSATNATRPADVAHQHHSRTPSPVRLATLPTRALSEAETSALAGAENALARREPVAAARCCRLVRLALLKDFPAEVFLIRSALVQRLATLVGDGGCAGEGSREELLETMEGVTAALRARLRCLSSPHFRHSVRRPTTHSQPTEERLNHRTADVATPEPMSVPSYCLLVLGQLLRVLNESFATPAPGEHNQSYNATEVERALCLLESALQLLLDSVPRELWAREHAAREHRRLAHTALLVMRAVAHLLANLRAQSEGGIRVDSTWTVASEVRVVRAGLRLARWARGAAAAPRALLAALVHHLPPAPLQLLYPDLNLQDYEADLDDETREKLKAARSQCAALESAARFVRGERTTETLLAALPALELLACEDSVRCAADVLLSARRELDVARGACVSLMAHRAQWVRAAFYARLEEGTGAALADDANADEGSLLVFNDVSVLTEMFSGGLCSSSAQVRTSAERMTTRLLGARSHLTESAWWKLAAALLPALPTLTCNAAHDTELGEMILQTLEPRAWESLGLPESERLATLVRLLFSSRAAVQADAAHRLCHTLLATSDCDSYLPPHESVRADVLLGALRRVEPANFNVDLSPPPESVRQGTIGLEQMLELLKLDAGEEGGGEAGGVEPSLRRGTLQRLAVVMQQPAVHEHFLRRGGLELVRQHLRWSLLVNERRTFPDCAESCVSILNGVVCTSTVAAYELADTPDLLMLLIRGMLVFPTQASFMRLSAQLACALALRGALVRRTGGTAGAGFALPHCIARRSRLPFPVIEYRAAASDDDSTVRAACPETESWARLRFACAWYGTERVSRWTHAPPPPRGFPPHLTPAPDELAALQGACAVRGSGAALLTVENATTHRAVDDALALLTGYARLVEWRGGAAAGEYAALPWSRALGRFVRARPASRGDAATLARVLRLLRAHLHACHAHDGAIPAENLRWLWEALRRRDGVMSLLEPTPDGAELASLRTDLVRLVRALCDVDTAAVDDGEGRNDLQHLLLECLERVDFTDLREMGYACELAACVRDSTGGDAWRRLAQLLTGAPLSEWAAGGGRRAGHALLRDLMLALARRMSSHLESVPRELVEAALACATKGRVELRTAALLVLANAMRAQPHTSVYTEDLVEAAARTLCDCCEASAARAAAASLLTNLTTHADGDTRVLLALEERGFPDAAVEILRSFYSTRKPELECVRGEDDVSSEPVVWVAELLHNLLIPQLYRRWSRHGLLSLLFRCMDTPDARVRLAACAALARAASSCTRVRHALALQHDCVRLLLRALARRTGCALYADAGGAAASGWWLAGELAAERDGAAALWSLLLQDADVDTCGAFFARLSAAVRTNCHDEREAALFCAERLTVALRQPELSTSRARWEDAPAPPGEGGGACEARYSVELVCDALLDHYERQREAPTHNWGAEGCCERACGALAALLAASARAQRRALHRALPHTLLRALRSLALPLHTQPEGEGEWRALVWSLALAQSSMVRCAAAKECYAGGELASALLRLWPRLASDDVPLDAALRLLATFTDGCERARADTTRCVLGRCLLLETCAAAAREMSSRPHAARLCVALRVVAQCASHPHARALIYKSAVMSSLSRLHPALTRARCAPAEEGGWRRAEAAWERVWCALARHADAPAAARLLEGRATLCALALQRGVMLRALALLAFRPQARLALLHSDEVLQTWARVLAGEGAAGAGEGALVACAAAVWAIAANNHKAKQVLRECGVTAGVASRLQRLQLSAAEQPADRAALQLLTYTHSVLQLR